ncbi:MAG: thiamine-phosphate kinase [Candidatus Omnitrophica bacterium]|nr:thiamine-phosphate kinase [Candidatus Omnitrophota bacterium]MDD5654045.1 thiamine-phosphate kinase [Candidatus Omnitrophota bacterium]
MKIRQIGEFGLIKDIKKMAGNGEGVVKGIGDDCAVVEFGRDKYLLLTTDMLIQDVDFLLRDDPYLIGSKSISASISDIAACGGLPAYALVSLGMPAETESGFVHDLYRGMGFWAKKHGINIIGGDMSKADKIVINISLAGFVEKKKLVLRSGARAGDIIFVTGMLGAASLDPRRLCVIPRLEEARYLAANFKMGAMIDISDGLLQDLKHVCDESGVGAVVYQDAVPVYKKGGDFIREVSRGEDFELLFTLPLKEARKLGSGSFINYTPIGNVVDKKYGLRMIDDNCKEKVIKPSGFRHF